VLNAKNLKALLEMSRFSQVVEEMLMLNSREFHLILHCSSLVEMSRKIRFVYSNLPIVTNPRGELSLQGIRSFIYVCNS
jgi:DNA-binding Lrp family transcriptional regulator